MVCLEDFYRETGFSRALLGKVLGISTDTLRKYEWSDTDRMRRSTVEKIEDGVHKLEPFGFQVMDLHFGQGFMVCWNNPEPGKRHVSGDCVAQFIRGTAGLH